MSTKAKSPNSLYLGDSLYDFSKACTPQSREPCTITSPEDFRRLNQVKLLIQEQVNFYDDSTRITVSLLVLLVVLVLFIHLLIVNHFNWRSLPGFNLIYDVEPDKDRVNGVKYHQYVWMKFLVLKGSHPTFRNRVFGEIKWFKYKKPDLKFDYKSVNTAGWKFLDKKGLTKHLADAVEAEMELGGPTTDHVPGAGEHPKKA